MTFLDFQYEFIASLITASAWPRLGPLTAIMNSSVVLSSFIFLLGSKWFSKTDTRDSNTDSQDILTQHTLIACITISISRKRSLSGSKNSFRISFGPISRSCSIEYCRVDSSNRLKNYLCCFFKSSSDTTLRDQTGTARTAFTNTGLRVTAILMCPPSGPFNLPVMSGKFSTVLVWPIAVTACSSNTRLSDLNTMLKQALIVSPRLVSLHFHFAKLLLASSCYVSGFSKQNSIFETTSVQCVPSPENSIWL